MKSILIQLLLFGILAQNLVAQIDITINGRYPFPVLAQNYLEDLGVMTAKIKNSGIFPAEIKMYAEITGPRGLSIATAEPTCEVVIAPFQLKTFGIGNYDLLCLNFNVNDINYGSLTQEQKSALIQHGILPEGNYSYCLTAKDADNGDVLSTSCLEFEIQFPDRPTLIQPMAETTLDGTIKTFFNITWTHVISDMELRQATKYNVKIVDMGSNNGQFPSENDATIVMNDINVNPFHNENDVTSTHALQVDNLPFIADHFYAVRITAYSDDFMFPAESAQSNIHVFQYVESDFECGRSFSVEPIYPAPNSIIPFEKLVPVVKYSPYCDSYRKFVYNTSIKSEGELQASYNRTMRWRKGPREFFERKTGLKDPDEYYSSHIGVSDYNAMFLCERAKEYNYLVTGEVRLENNKTFTYDTGLTSFSIGMPPFKLNYPVGGQLVSPGAIVLNAIHVQVPDQPLPPFRVNQIIDEDIFEYPPLNINELAVVQVSKKINFDTVIYTSTLSITGNDANYQLEDRKYDVPRFISEIYRELSAEINLQDTITYYWRVAWTQLPSTFDPSTDIYKTDAHLYYNESEIDSFKVSINVGTQVAVESTPSVEENSNAKCKTLCEIPPITNQSDFVGSLENETIKVGQFNMEIVQIEKSGSTYNGEGLVEIPFIRKVKLKTSFSNIKINTDKVVYQGIVTGKESGNELETLNTLLLGQHMELPFGWDTTIQNIHLTLGITGIIFNPTNAFMQVSLDMGDALSLLHESDNYPVMTADVCFQPGGYEKDLFLYHQNDIVLDENESGYGFVFKGGQSLSDTTGMTYVKWGCEGFIELQLGGAVIFSQNLLLKDSGLTSDDTPINERVKGHFTFKYNKLHQDVMITARMEDFQFKDHMKGWGFDTDTIFIDFSDNTNPPGFEVPEGYGAGYFTNPATASTWKGVYIPRAKVLSPESFVVDGFRATMGFSTMILGDGIYYLRHRAYNVMNEGIIGRLSATIDTIDGVISNMDFRYRMTGKLKMPFVEEGAFLNFSGLYDDIEDWNFLVQVGNDSIVAPIFMSHLTLYQNSLISFSKDPVTQKHRFRFLLNGHLSADDRLKTNYISRLKNVKLLSIVFEEMEYETYKGFVNKPVFRMASPAKSLNGFPIQIDSIDFTTYNGNPGLYIKPKLVLVSDTDGFSVSAGLIFYAEMQVSGPKDEFLNPNAFLSDVNIHIAKNGFKLDGVVKFIAEEGNDGIEGVLAASLPGGIEGNFKAKFGNVGAQSGAPFNSAGYYNYWYVDAMIAFGSAGFPIFSGVNLYGLGGGLWYNMKQDTLHQLNIRDMMKPVATTAGNVQHSGIPYHNYFGGGDGFRLRGLFGNPGGGDKFNMLLAVKADFPASGGPIVSLRGDVYLMSKLQSINAEGKIDETQKAFWGFAEIVYNGQEHFIDAVLQMNVLIKKADERIIEGIGPNSRMVNAHFHTKTAGENYWYLLVGTPAERGGIKMDLKIKKASAEGYAMFGHGIPIEIPEPDPQFMAMLNNKKDNYSSSSGDPNSVLNKPIDLTGYGIAFGAVVKDSFNFKYQPFYLIVKVIMGFDFNLTKNSERKCVETGNVPGYNDWYGMGQLYAGISGEFGIHVDMFFVKGDFQIFKGSIAALMSGGLPNPSWFYCRGTMKYEVLGLIEGSHTFELVLGQKCTLGNGNPFSDSPVIIDTKPQDGDTDVSVFTLPTVSYAFPINTELSFIDEKVGPRIFKILIDQVSLKTVDGPLYKLERFFDNDNYITCHKPDEVLNATANHTFYVKIKAKEKLLSTGQWTSIKEGTSDWAEDKTVHFKTGTKPDSIDPLQLDYTYPMHQQRFFMKGETFNNSGIIRLNSIDDQLLYIKHPVTAQTYHYEIIFNSFTGGEPSIKEHAIATDFQNISFNVDRLKPNQVYNATLRRVKGVFSSHNAIAYVPSNISATYANAVFTNKKEGEYEYNILPARMVSLGTAASASVEKDLFTFYFRTSQFDNLHEKVDAITWNAPRYALLGTLEDIIHDGVNPEEGFDVFEMEGYQRQPRTNFFTTQNGFVKSGVHYQVGEYYGENRPFDYLGNDEVIIQNNLMHFESPNALSEYHSSLLSYIRTKVNTPTYTSISTELNSIHGRLKFGIPVSKIAKQFYNSTLGPYIITQPSNSVSINLPINLFTQSGSTFSPPPPKTFKVRLEYGTQYFINDFFNKSEIVNYLAIGGTYLELNNLSLYRRLSGFVNQPVVGNIWHCQDAAFGIIYQFPWLDSNQIGTKWKKDYVTPGPCIEDID